MIEAYESVSLTNGSGSERPKNTGSKDPVKKKIKIIKMGQDSGSKPMPSWRMQKPPWKILVRPIIIRTYRYRNKKKSSEFRKKMSPVSGVWFVLAVGHSVFLHNLPVDWTVNRTIICWCVRQGCNNMVPVYKQIPVTRTKEPAGQKESCDVDPDPEGKS